MNHSPAHFHGCRSLICAITAASAFFSPFASAAPDAHVAIKSGFESPASPTMAPTSGARSAGGESPFVVMIDPGHGGRDRGATREGLTESAIALKVGLKLAELLKQDHRFQVAMTRSTDKTLTLSERTEIASRAKADLFLSIHLNSSTDAHAQGKEFYFQNQLPVDEESMFLASRENSDQTSVESAADNATASTTDTASTSLATEAVDAATTATAVAHRAHATTDRVSKNGDVHSILDDLKRNARVHASSELSQILFETWSNQDDGKTKRHGGSRAIRQAPFFVITNSLAPSVLVELGFITHPVEGPRLALETYQNELAEGLYAGLVKFKETVDKEHSGPLNSAHEPTNSISD